MASGNEVTYSSKDKLDEFLAQDISTYVIFSKLSTFANDLRVPRREMERIMAPNCFQQDQRVKEVLNFWLQQKTTNYTVQNFVDDLKRWQKNGHVDREAVPYIESRIKYQEEQAAGNLLGPTITTTPRQQRREKRNNEATGSLKDRQIWGLAQKFTNVSDLRSLALKGLKLEGYTIDATFYNNSQAIQEAAYKVLVEWVKRQENKQKVYTKLLKALAKCSFHMMGTELKESVENPSSDDSS